MKKPISADEIIHELHMCSSEKRRKTVQRYFKTEPGEYSHGDVFIGVPMPDIRIIAKKYMTLSLTEGRLLMCHEVHEARLCMLVILVLQYKAGDERERVEIIEYYLAHKEYINNWDLVDVSVHYIVGQGIIDGILDEDALITLSQSSNIWERRMSIVANWTIIRTGNIDILMRICLPLLGDNEDLIHKAIGWMLREAWKKDSETIEAFLITNYSKIHRTTLRYAIERMPEVKRLEFLHYSV